MTFKPVAAAVLALLAILPSGRTYGQQKSGTASKQEKIEALKELRDSGVITDQEYQSKVRDLGGIEAPSSTTGRLVWPGTRTVQADDSRYQMTAFTFEVPTNWKYIGSVDVSGKGTCHAGEPSLKVTAQSPDSLYAVMQLPGVQWAANSSAQAEEKMARRGCPPVEIKLASDFIANILLPELHPNAKIVEVLPPGAGLDAAMQQKFEADSQIDHAVTQATGIPSPDLKFDGTRIRVEYELDGGRPVEEMISGFVECSELRMPNGSTSRGCGSSNLLLIRAPQGHLDELLALPEFVAMMKSRKANPEWTSRVQNDKWRKVQETVSSINQQRAFTQNLINASNAAFQAQMQASQAFFDQLSRNNAQFNANLQASTARSIAESQAQQRRRDYETHQWVNYALDQRDYINPYNGQTVTASNRFAQQWISNDGRYVAGSNTGANPNDYIGAGGPTFSPLIPK